MKRTIVMLVALILLLIPVNAFAASKTYEIPELDMSIDIPEDLIVFPRDVAPNDPNLVLLTLDEKSLEKLYLERSIYLNAIQTDPLAEIVVTMIEIDTRKGLYDFNLLNEEQFEALYEEAVNSEEVKQNNATYTGYTIYKHAQATFLKISLHQPYGETEAYGIQYYTVINGQAINVTIHSYHGEITQADENLIKSVVDSVHFSKVKEKPKSMGAIDIGESLMVGGVAAVITALVGIIRKRKKNKAQTDPYK